MSQETKEADPMSVDEASLIRMAQRGDIQSFEALIRPYQTKLYGMARSITGNAEDAEDAFQETVVHAFRAIARFRGDAAFATWLYRIALNVGRNWVRSQYRASSGRISDRLPVSSDEYAPDPEEVLISREQIDTIRRALLGLPDHYRETLMLRHYEDFSYEQIALILNVPVGTVRSRLAQGRKYLLELLAADDHSICENRR